MKEREFSRENCLVVTDDSCCLNNEELMKLNVVTVPYEATTKQLETSLKKLLEKKEFILFAGTAPSLSTINKTVKDAVKKLDEKDKSLNAKERVIIINTSCFSGGLGLFVTLFSDFFLSGSHSLDDIQAFCLFLANHIAHFFIEPNEKRWNNLIYVPRTGPVNYDGGKFRGNKGVYNHLAANFRDFAYHPEEKVWVCYSGYAEHEIKCRDDLTESEISKKTESFAQARSLAKQIKRCHPESRLDISHKIMPNSVDDFSDKVIACFFLSTDVRPDEPGPDYDERQYQEIQKKTMIARNNITEITRFSQAYRKSPCPEF